MKSLSAIVLTILLVPAAIAVEPPAVPEPPTIPEPPTLPSPKLPDGITALTAPLGTTGAYYFEEPDIRFEIAIFEKDAKTGAWGQVARAATARMAVYDAEGEHDVFSGSFTSSATGRVVVTIPGELVNDQPFDFWITMWRPDETYPTVHHSLPRNMLIMQEQFDAADALDYHHVLNPYAAG